MEPVIQYGGDRLAVPETSGKPSAHPAVCGQLFEEEGAVSWDGTGDTAQTGSGDMQRGDQPEVP